MLKWIVVIGLMVVTTPQAVLRAETTLSERALSHATAGEYGLAISVAQQISNPEEQTAVLKQISKTQMEAGDLSASRLTGRTARSRTARTTGREEPRRQELNGGSSGADFGPLMDLIRQLTGGEQTGTWDEEGLEGEGTGGQMLQYDNGVSVDPQGTLKLLSRPEHTHQLAALGIRARRADLSNDMNVASPLRFVSLTRLEREIAQRIRDGQPVLETMQCLAGLTQVKYVFVLPEEREVVIAGPAEGWAVNSNGLRVSQHTQRPVVQLDDLVTVLRTFGPGGKAVYGCSIDPRPAHLKSTRDFLSEHASRPLAPTAVTGWLKQIEDRMGLQDIVIYGVPADSRVGRVMVDADYRMKLIGIGKLNSQVGIPSVFDLLASQKSAEKMPLNALRWWLTMNYSSIVHSADKHVFELQGSSVLVKSEDQMISSSGAQVGTGKASAVNQRFAELFTQRYAELAKRDLAFADLQNVFDLGMIAAVLRSEHLAEKVGWNMGVFAVGGAYQPAHWQTPRVVKSVLDHRSDGNSELVVQVAGGVRADLLAVLGDHDKVRGSDAVKPLDREGKKPQGLPAGRWWWDAAAK